MTNQQRDADRPLYSVCSVAIGRILLMLRCGLICKKSNTKTKNRTSGYKVIDKKLRHRRGTARHTMSVEILSNIAQLYEKLHLKGLQYGMTLKVTQGHLNCLYSIGYISLPTWSVVITTVSGTVSKILRHIQCT